MNRARAPARTAMNGALEMKEKPNTTANYLVAAGHAGGETTNIAALPGAIFFI